jgi:hypothetical protein
MSAYPLLLENKTIRWIRFPHHLRKNLGEDTLEPYSGLAMETRDEAAASETGVLAEASEGEPEVYAVGGSVNLAKSCRGRTFQLLSLPIIPVENGLKGQRSDANAPPALANSRRSQRSEMQRARTALQVYGREVERAIH